MPPILTPALQPALRSLAVIVAAMLPVGCTSPQPAGDSGEHAAQRDSAGTTGRASESAPAAVRPDQIAAARRADSVELQYVIGPQAARSFGFRIDWQTTALTTNYKHILVQDDAILLLDERNMLARIDRNDGRVIWRVPVAREMADAYSISYVPWRERILVLTGPELLLLDAATGSLTGIQPLLHIANTPGTVLGPYLLYGSRNGLLIWHQYELGAFLRGYSVASSMRIRPVHDGEFVLAIGVDGRMMSVTAGSASMVWSHRALATVSAAPTISQGIAFIASEDQYIRAFEVDRSRSPRWQRLMSSPLTDSPVVIDDRVYQRVAGVGLVCFEAFPPSAPGGVLVWTAEDSTGQVVRTSGSDLLTWDPLRRRMEIVDAALGAVAGTIAVPRARHIISERIDGDDLIIIGDQGEVLRLIPRFE